MPRITDFCICIYVLGCRLSVVRLCDSDFGITPVDDIAIAILLLYVAISLFAYYLPMVRIISNCEFSLFIGFFNPLI